MIQKRETAMLLLVLGSFHLGLLQDPGSLLGKAVLLVHFGVVLLWQPLVSAQHRLSPKDVTAIVGLVGMCGILLSWGLVLMWGLMLAGAVGGRLFTHARARARIPYWLALVALVIDLVGLVVPELLREAGQGGASPLVALSVWLVLPFFALIMILPVQEEAREEASALDLVGSLLIVLVLTGVVLGALSLMFLRRIDYLQALLLALGLMAGCLLILAWFWGQHGGFAGLGLEVSRRMLSGGAHRMPLDRWLEQVADLAIREISPEAFLLHAAKDLLQWPGVIGLRWQTVPESAQGIVHCGEVSNHPCEFALRGLLVTVYTRQALANTALWQLDLMLRILAEIHASKLQTRQLQSDSYLRAVHETGARVTHEVKNLLQSLHGLCFAVLAMNEKADPRAQQMLARQLPLIVERLEQATARIRKPSDESMRMEPVARWWPRQHERFAARPLEWRLVGELADGGELPAALFDNVLDNLVDNALSKPHRYEARLKVTVSLYVETAGCALEVQDDGEAIPETKAESLFLAPQASDSGLGIGLYQASRLAESTGYQLALVDNRAGQVRFRLSPLKR